MMTRRSTTLVKCSLVLTLVTLWGCSSTAPFCSTCGALSSSSFDAISNITSQSRQDDCVLDVVLDRSPERPFVVLGMVSAARLSRSQQEGGETQSDIVPDLRVEACRAGGHVLFRVSATIEDHLWFDGARSRFARTVAGTGIVAVYVTPAGDELPPPRVTRDVIRVPTRLERHSAPEPAPSSSTPDGGQRRLEWDQGISDPWAVPAP